jgi:PAS domain S-box-containing protein
MGTSGFPDDTAPDISEPLAAICANCPGIVYRRVFYPDGRIEYPYVSGAIRSIFGIDPEHVIANSSALLDRLHPEDQDKFLASLRISERDLTPWSLDFRIIDTAHEVHWICGNAVPIGRPTGEVVSDGLLLDLTVRKKEEKDIQFREHQLRDFAELNSDVFFELNSDLRFTYISSVGHRGEKIDPDVFIGKTHEEIFIGPEWSDIDREIKEIKNKNRYVVERKSISTPGRFIRTSAKPIYSDDGTFEGYRGTTLDITDRKKAETELAESEQRFRSLVEGSIQGMFVHRDLQLLFANEECARILGYENLRELQAAGPIEQHFHPDERDRLRGYAEARLRGDTLPSTYELRALRKDGSSVWLENRVTLVEWDEEPAIQSVFYDITERKLAEAGLSASEQRFRSLVEHAPEAITMLDVDTGLYVDANPMAEVLHGLPRDELIGKIGPADLSPEIQVDGRLSAEAAPDYLSRALAGEFPRFEWMHLDPDGKKTLCEVSLARLPDPHRNLVRASITDITERKAAETHRAELEAELAQAKKLDAIGQLTAGVAHDFNNMLAVILGNAELLEDELGADNPRLAAVFQGTKRAADLTQRLLAFSRKQVLSPEIINVNTLIADITGLLRRTLEEHIDIETVIGAGLWNCEVDRGQLENALVNLALNARDAMPDGGLLTIETANARLDDDYAAAQAEVKPGQYVMLAVTDTGSGMPPEVRDHIFEPFYTTKEVGKGTGLGLSMIYGFVKQSGGHVTFYSELGEGTTIKLYLPRSTKKEAAANHTVPDEVPVAQGETVLVVEDDPNLRTLAVALLSNLGYQVVEAATGEAALEQLESISGVNLLLTDVMLPGGMNGRELAREIAKHVPGIHVLFMSGYTENAIVHHGRLDADATLLQKPFRRADLARAVRKALDGSST